MSRKEKLIVALVAAFAIALGAGFALKTSETPSRENSSAEAAPPAVYDLPAPDRTDDDPA